MPPGAGRAGPGRRGGYVRRRRRGPRWPSHERKRTAPASIRRRRALRRPARYRSRISLLVGLVGTLVNLVIGVTWGAVAGYRGGRLDDFMMRIVDILYSLPYIFLVILLLVFFSRSLVMLFVALGLVQWLTMARIVRGQVLSLKQQAFVEAARALGAGDGSIIFRHIVPNTLGPVIVYTTLTVPAVILQEAFLSFLRLGVQPPAASWGTLVSDGARVLALFPRLVIFPGVALSLTLLCFNFLADRLRGTSATTSRPRSLGAGPWMCAPVSLLPRPENVMLQVSSFVAVLAVMVENSAHLNITSFKLRTTVPLSTRAK